MLAISWFYCPALLERFAVSRFLSARPLMGGVAFTLVMIAEMLLGFGLFMRSLPPQVRKMSNGVGLAGPAGQLAFAAFRLLLLRRGGRNQGNARG